MDCLASELYKDDPKGEGKIYVHPKGPIQLCLAMNSLHFQEYTKYIEEAAFQAHLNNAQANQVHREVLTH